MHHYQTSRGMASSLYNGQRQVTSLITSYCTIQRTTCANTHGLSRLQDGQYNVQRKMTTSHGEQYLSTTVPSFCHFLVNLKTEPIYQ